MINSMKVSARNTFGKKTKNLRLSGLLPAVIYGHEVNLSVQIPLTDFLKTYTEKGHTGISKITMDENVYNVLIDQIQINPVSRSPIHVTFRNVDMKEEINATVPISYINTEEAIGVKDEDGIVVENLSEVEVLALPANIPSILEVNVANLHLGDAIKLEDIKLPEGVRFATQDENLLSQVIVTITHKAQEEVVPEVAEEFVVAEATKEKKTEEEPAAEEK